MTTESPEPKALRERVADALLEADILADVTDGYDLYSAHPDTISADIGARAALLAVADWLDEQGTAVEIEYVSEALRLVAADLRREAS